MGPGEFRWQGHRSLDRVLCGLAPLWAMRHGLTTEPNPPLLGGRYTLERQLAGSMAVLSPLIPYGISSPDGPPYKGFSVGTSQESWENSILLLPECLES